MYKTYVPRTGYLTMNPFELHKHLINTYVLDKKGATNLLKRDTSRDKTDSDVLRENHKFLWEDDDEPQSWEESLARKYYDKLFKEFCISDLSRYKENKIAMRWQTEQELVTGKGQFVCGNKICSIKDNLKTWEVNFAYKEHGERKNALVKLRLCVDCSAKLNYKNKRKEIKRIKSKTKTKHDKHKNKTEENETNPEEEKEEDKNDGIDKSIEKEDDGSDIWKKPIVDVEAPSRDQEFDKFLEHLLL